MNLKLAGNNKLLPALLVCKFKHFEKVGDLVRYFKQDLPKLGSWIWVKGSQNTIFLEVLVESLLAKPADKMKLARQGNDWDHLREGYL